MHFVELRKLQADPVVTSKNKYESQYKNDPTSHLIYELSKLGPKVFLLFSSMLLGFLVIPRDHSEFYILFSIHIVLKVLKDIPRSRLPVSRLHYVISVLFISQN